MLVAPRTPLDVAKLVAELRASPARSPAAAAAARRVHGAGPAAPNWMRHRTCVGAEEDAGVAMR